MPTFTTWRDRGYTDQTGLYHLVAGAGLPNVDWRVNPPGPGSPTYNDDNPIQVFGTSPGSPPRDKPLAWFDERNELPPNWKSVKVYAMGYNAGDESGSSSVHVGVGSNVDSLLSLKAPGTVAGAAGAAASLTVSSSLATDLTVVAGDTRADASHALFSAVQPSVLTYRYIDFWVLMELERSGKLSGIAMGNYYPPDPFSFAPDPYYFGGGSVLSGDVPADLMALLETRGLFPGVIVDMQGSNNGGLFYEWGYQIELQASTIKAGDFLTGVHHLG